MSSNLSPAVDDLALYRIRDDIARGLNPRDAYEVRLVTNIARNELRYRQLFTLQQRMFCEVDPTDILGEGFKKLAMLDRMVAAAERAVRAATSEFHRERRLRAKEDHDAQFHGLPKTRHASIDLSEFDPPPSTPPEPPTSTPPTNSTPPPS